MGQLLEAKRFMSKPEADIAASFLHSHDIHAVVFADNEGNMAPHLTLVTAARLLVPEEDLETAKRLLAEMAEDAIPPSHDDSTPAIDGGVNADARRAYYACIVGFVFLPVVANLYSLWLLVTRVLPQSADLSRTAKWQTLAATLLNLLMLAGVAYLVMRN